MPDYGNVYDTIYQNYGQYFDFFIMQYYKWTKLTFSQIFIQSDTYYTPNTSVLELINEHNIDPKKIVVGKNISTTAAGYVPLSTDMVTYVEEAF